MPLSVIGAGLGRTGTLSLKLALERLGLGPCHHMREVFRHPRLLRHWQDAAALRPVAWEEVFAGYHSAVDWPSTHFWRELAAAYPEAKIILTVRPEAAWWASFSRTIPLLLRRRAEVSDPHVRGVLAMAASIVVEQAMGGRPEDEATALARYRRQIAEVTAEVAPEASPGVRCRRGLGTALRLSGAAGPDEPFPRTNSLEEFWDPSRPGRPPRTDPITKPDDHR